MANDAGSTWVSVTSSVGKVSALTQPVPRGVWIVGASAFAFGFANTITWETAAVTDGFPLPANVPFFIAPGMFPLALAPDLMNLYLITTGTVNVWLSWPHA